MAAVCTWAMKRKNYPFLLTMRRLIQKIQNDGWTAGKVTSSDLSAQACQRANAIFNIESVPNDIHALQFQDNSFDVVLCSESLEHVARPFDAIAELIRIARTAVIITVPHESQADVAKSVAERTPHGHINYFDIHSFEYLKKEGYTVTATPVLMRTGITNQMIYSRSTCVPSLPH